MVGGFPAAVLLLRILMAELGASYESTLGPSSRRVPSVYTDIAELRVSYISKFGLSSHCASTAHIDDGASHVGGLGLSSRRPPAVHTYGRANIGLL